MELKFIPKKQFLRESLDIPELRAQELCSFIDAMFVKQFSTNEAVDLVTVLAECAKISTSLEEYTFCCVLSPDIIDIVSSRLNKGTKGVKITIIGL